MQLLRVLWRFAKWQRKRVIGQGAPVFRIGAQVNDERAQRATRRQRVGPPFQLVKGLDRQTVGQGRLQIDHRHRVHGLVEVHGRPEKIIEVDRRDEVERARDGKQRFAPVEVLPADAHVDFPVVERRQAEVHMRHPQIKLGAVVIPRGTGHAQRGGDARRRALFDNQVGLRKVDPVKHTVIKHLPAQVHAPTAVAALQVQVRAPATYRTGDVAPVMGEVGLVADLPGRAGGGHPALMRFEIVAAQRQTRVRGAERRVQVGLADEVLVARRDAHLRPQGKLAVPVEGHARQPFQIVERQRGSRVRRQHPGGRQRHLQTGQSHCSPPRAHFFF